MESDKPGADDPSAPNIEVLHKDDGAGVATVTELMDRIERTALERYFAARAYRWKSNPSKQTPSAG